MSGKRIVTSLIGALVRVREDTCTLDNPLAPQEYLGADAEVVGVSLRAGPGGEDVLSLTLKMHGFGRETGTFPIWDNVPPSWIDIVDLTWRRNRG